MIAFLAVMSQLPQPKSPTAPMIAAFENVSSIWEETHLFRPIEVARLASIDTSLTPKPDHMCI